MTKRWQQLFFILTLLLVFTQSYAAMSQTIQIYTHLNKIAADSSWLLIVHDTDSSAVYPYVFNMNNKDDYFLIFTNARNYRLVSILQFDFYRFKINNFCQLPTDKITGQSLIIKITGTLTPDPMTSKCYIMKYRNE